MPENIQVLAFDVFGTTVDWHTGISQQVAASAARNGVSLDADEFADAWRDRYLPAMQRVNTRERDWVYLDTLHRESLDELLDRHGVEQAFDDAARRDLVRAWHRLPAWDDAVEGLDRLRRKYITAALSNGGFALLTNLVKGAGLPFDCILSAELARIYKPAVPAYTTAVGLLDVEPASVMMVASHRWDLYGARSAGLRTAFVERPREKGPNRAADTAAEVDSDVSVGSFLELADVLGC